MHILMLCNPNVLDLILIFFFAVPFLISLPKTLILMDVKASPAALAKDGGFIKRD